MSSFSLYDGKGKLFLFIYFKSKNTSTHTHITTHTHTQPPTHFVTITWKVVKKLTCISNQQNKHMPVKKNWKYTYKCLHLWMCWFRSWWFPVRKHIAFVCVKGFYINTILILTWHVLWVEWHSNSVRNKNRNNNNSNNNYNEGVGVVHKHKHSYTHMHTNTSVK